MIRCVKVRDYFETYTRCYFLIDEKSRHGFLVDPGAEAQKILSVIQENGWIIEKILLTHGHFDHLEAVDIISKTLHIPYSIHEIGKKYLENPMYNLSGYCQRNLVLQDAVYLHDSEEVSLEANPNYKVKVIHTPGHTEDSIILYLEREQAAVVGDTIFLGSMGSTQYPGGSQAQLIHSIRDKIFCLPKDTRLLSGHSEETTVAAEMRRYGW